MLYLRPILTLFFVCLHFTGKAQVVGGRFAMEFLRLPNAPHISALGGINVSNPEPDISFALQNPSLMRPGLHNQLGINYNSYYAGIKTWNLNYGYHIPSWETSFVLGVQYLDYGSFEHTDPVGQMLGTFRATDYALTLGFSRKYKTRWHFGASLKYAQSTLFEYKASALLADVGITYFDTGNLFTISAVAKNIGFMLTRYQPQGAPEPLPFDLQLGVSKRFEHLPLRLMATVHHLYEWDIRYNDPALITSTGLLGTADSSELEKTHFGDKLFRHFIFAAEFTLAKRLALSLAYNPLRRGEMSLKERPALAGLSFGANLYLNKIQIHYARSYYHIVGAYNELGLNFALNELFDVHTINTWNNRYPDWF